MLSITLFCLFYDNLSVTLVSKITILITVNYILMITIVNKANAINPLHHSCALARKLVQINCINITLTILTSTET